MLLKLLRSYLPFIAGLVTGIYFINLSLLGNGLTYFPGDLADARFNNYLLEHAHLFFTGKIDSFWNAPFMYPEEKVITYSDNLLGTAPFYSLLRLIGLERTEAFQYWFLLISIFNYTACYFFLVYLFKNKYAAVMGAMTFAFSIALQSQVGHAQTYPRFAIPIALWMGIKFIKELHPKYFFLTLFFFTYQMYCGIYLGFMLFVPLALILLLSLFFKWQTYKIHFKQNRWLAMMALAVIANILLLLPLMLPYIERAKETGFYPYERIIESLPSLLSFFYSHKGNEYWDFLSETATHYAAFWDHQIFPGGVATLCMIAFILVVFVKCFNRNFRTEENNQFLIMLFLSGLITFLLFVRFGSFSFYKIIYHIPGFGSMRALQRIINIELIFYAIAVSYALSFILRKESIFTLFVSLAAIALIILDNHIDPQTAHREEKAKSQKRVDELVNKMKNLKQGSIISYEPDTIISKAIFYQLDGMLASQTLKLKCLNGYSSTSPKGYSDYWVMPNEENRMVWLNTKNFPLDSVKVVH
jgi:hypothetical protein